MLAFLLLCVYRLPTYLDRSINQVFINHLYRVVQQACLTAYGVYTSCQDYGQEYRLALRKLIAQRQILESLMRLKLEDLILEKSNDKRQILETIKGELVTVRVKFEICQKLINKLVVKSEAGNPSGIPYLELSNIALTL